MPYRCHTHYIYRYSTINYGHRHRAITTSDTAIPVNGGHIHCLKTYTTYNNQHVHCFCTYTSRGIYLSNGTHYHLYRRYTSFNNGHRHYISGQTSRTPYYLY